MWNIPFQTISFKQFVNSPKPNPFVWINACNGSIGKMIFLTWNRTTVFQSMCMEESACSLMKESIVLEKREPRGRWWVGRAWIVWGSEKSQMYCHAALPCLASTRLSASDVEQHMSLTPRQHKHSHTHAHTLTDAQTSNEALEKKDCVWMVDEQSWRRSQGHQIVRYFWNKSLLSDGLCTCWHSTYLLLTVYFSLTKTKGGPLQVGNKARIRIW
jgi:hypothetical protein